MSVLDDYELLVAADPDNDLVVDAAGRLASSVVAGPTMRMRSTAGATGGVDGNVLFDAFEWNRGFDPALTSSFAYVGAPVAGRYTAGMCMAVDVSAGAFPQLSVRLGIVRSFTNTDVQWVAGHTYGEPAAGFPPGTLMFLHCAARFDLERGDTIVGYLNSQPGLGVPYLAGSCMWAHWLGPLPYDAPRGRRGGVRAGIGADGALELDTAAGGGVVLLPDGLAAVNAMGVHSAKVKRDSQLSPANFGVPLNVNVPWERADWDRGALWDPAVPTDLKLKAPGYWMLQGVFGVSNISPTPIIGFQVTPNPLAGAFQPLTSGPCAVIQSYGPSQIGLGIGNLDTVVRVTDPTSTVRMISAGYTGASGSGLTDEGYPHMSATWLGPL